MEVIAQHIMQTTHFGMDLAGQEIILRVVVMLMHPIGMAQEEIITNMEQFI
jgi:hypothetical protein